MKNKKNISPLVQTLLEAYLRQDNIEIKFYPNTRNIYEIKDESVGVFRILQNKQEVMKINVRDDDLKICGTIMRSISYVTC